MSIVCSSVGSSTITGWKRRSSAASRSMYLRYSSRVVAPMHWSSPRGGGGVRVCAGSARPLRSAGPPERVQLVDEEDRVVRAAKLLDDLLEALLELAAVLRAGHEGSDVERQHALVEEGFGHVAGDDPLCQPLGDGRLADAGFTDEGRVVLGAPGEDLDDPLDLLLAPDDGVDLAGPDRVGGVEAGLVERGRSPRPVMTSTAVRTLASSTFMFSRTRAATPSPSRTSPSSRCSVPM